MISDDERREVARRIRETGEELGSSALLWYHIAKALGVRTATDGKTACGMLADLIEPSERACYYYDAETNHCRCYDTRLVDLDALLELVQAMDSRGKCASEENGGDGEVDAWWLRQYAHLIRETLGVDDDW